MTDAPSPERKWYCTFDNSNLKPCTALREVCDTNGLSKKKGVYIPFFMNMETETSRQPYAALKCGKYPDGIVFGFCPFCGTKIHTGSDHG